MTACFAVRRLRGSAWDSPLPLREQRLWSEHAAFMDDLTGEGFVLLGGTLGGTEGALLIVNAATEEEVRTRLAQDPWSISGHLVTGRIDAWTILLNSGRL
jgi:uncharacterized protein YciI